MGLFLRASLFHHKIRKDSTHLPKKQSKASIYHRVAVWDGAKNKTQEFLRNALINIRKKTINKKTADTVLLKCDTAISMASQCCNIKNIGPTTSSFLRSFSSVLAILGGISLMYFNYSSSLRKVIHSVFKTIDFFQKHLSIFQPPNI